MRIKVEHFNYNLATVFIPEIIKFDKFTIFTYSIWHTKLRYLYTQNGKTTTQVHNRTKARRQGSQVRCQARHD